MTQAAAASTSQLAPEISSGRKDNDDDRIQDVGRCSLCGAGPCASGALGQLFIDALPACHEGLRADGRRR
ncbi:hypothetical protein BE20_05955 [Sorangium cellulosum]|nr:hypothetical protein BE20_05955 [Sorangium cellulosum]